jgi:hypothetical protein
MSRTPNTACSQAQFTVSGIRVEIGYIFPCLPSIWFGPSGREEFKFRTTSILFASLARTASQAWDLHRPNTSLGWKIGLLILIWNG